MTDDPRRRHLTPEEAAELRRRARERRARQDAGQARPADAPRRAPRGNDGPRPPRRDPRARGAAAGGAAGAGAAGGAGARGPGDPRGAAGGAQRSGGASGYQPRQRPEPVTDPRERRGRPDPRGQAPRPGPGDPRGPRAGGYRGEYRGRRGRHPSRRSLLRRVGIGRILALVLVLVLVGGLASIMWVDSKLTRIDAITDYDGRGGNTPGRITLIVGTDSREGLSAEEQERLATGAESDVGGRRTDTMMLAYDPPGGGESMLISLPRDMLVTVPGYGEDKLNSAFALGGPQLLVQTLEQQTGVRVDHYMEVGFGGFAGIVDALDGVEVCLDEPVSDPMAGIQLTEGCQTLDGPQSLGFVRSRYGFAEQDLQRVRNQRMFLGALVDEAASPGVLLNPFKAWPLINESAEAVTVDSGDHVWNLAMVLWGLRGDLTTTTLPHDGVASGSVGSYLVWGQTTTAFFDAVREGEAPADHLLGDLPA